MAQPPAYNRQVDFTDRTSDQTDHPALNAELDDAAQAINLLRDNLAAIQRDDKSLRLPRAALRPDELSALAGQALAAASAAEDDLAAAQVAAQAAVTAAQTAQARVAAAFAGGQDRGDWSPQTLYQAGQIVWVGNTGYQAALDHTSAATFAADLAAGKWVVFQGVTRGELAAAGGTTLVGTQVDASLPVKTFDIYVKSAPIPLAAAVPGNMVTDGSVDYSLDLQKAIDYLGAKGGGQITLPPKSIIRASNLKLRTGVEIIGHDWTTIIDVDADKYGFIINPGAEGTSNVDENLRNIALRGFKVRGKVASAGFQEHTHLLNFNAASWVEVEQMCIEGFRGDGIYLGSSNVGGLERHNTDIKIISGVINGVNNDNRNGVSVIDCDGLEIHGVRFKNTTRPNMPGAIDIEPDANPYHIVKNISATGNYFKNIGGNVGVISIVLMDVAWAEMPRNFGFHGNTMEIAGSNASPNGFCFLSRRANSAASESPEICISMSKNSVTSDGAPFAFFGLRGISASDNTYRAKYSSLIGYVDSGKCADVSLINDKYYDSGRSSSGGLTVFNVSNLTVAGGLFRNCGNESAIYFSTGQSDNVSICDTTFINSSHKYAILKTAGHTFTQETNTDAGNKLNGLASNFQSKSNNALLSLNKFSFDDLPDSFPAGVSETLVNLPSGAPAGTGANGQGVLRTDRPSILAGYEKFTYQTFVHANNTTKLGSTWIRRRKQTLNEWERWYEQVGV